MVHRATGSRPRACFRLAQRLPKAGRRQCMPAGGLGQAKSCIAYLHCYRPTVPLASRAPEHECTRVPSRAGSCCHFLRSEEMELIVRVLLKRSRNVIKEDLAALRGLNRHPSKSHAMCLCEGL
jgi:hypothetical protein